MLCARQSTIPRRKHKMVFVDFSNPFLRRSLESGHYLRQHETVLRRVTDQLQEWAAFSRAEEARADARAGARPRPLAATVDIDEVILANIHMNSFQASAGVQGPEAIDFHAADYYIAPDGRPWPRDDLRLNPLLPGAGAFIRRLVDLGVKVFLITGRLEDIRDETVENLIHVGLAGAGPGYAFSPADLASSGGSLIMCPPAEYPPRGESIRPYKEGRRRAIEQTHRIFLNIGDQVSDLGLYGDTQILMPNPFYSTP